MESWRDIEGYEGYYQVSNAGKVRSLDRISIMKNGVKRTNKGKVLALVFDGKAKYLYVSLSKDGIAIKKSVHRLVGKTFTDGYFEGSEIDHIDTNPINNNALNLRWTDRSGNMKNPITYQNTINHHVEKQRIPVMGTNKTNGYILQFDYVRQAKKNGFKGIGENIHGRASHCKGYIWRYNIAV